MRRSIALAILCMSVAACGSRNEERKVDRAAIAAALKTSEQEMAGSLKAKDAEAWASHYAADATMMIPFEAAVSGRDRIKADIVRFLADPNFSLTFESDSTQVAASGDMAYTRGRFTATQTDPKTKQKVGMSGNYATIFRKQANNEWKAVEDIASPGAPGTAAPSS
jgi:uncharacterized protein (TIGR02246 family)